MTQQVLTRKTFVSFVKTILVTENEQRYASAKKTFKRVKHLKSHLENMKSTNIPFNDKFIKCKKILEWGKNLSIVIYILIFFVGIMTWHKYLPSHTIGNRP